MKKWVLFGLIIVCISIGFAASGIGAPSRPTEASNAVISAILGGFSPDEYKEGAVSDKDIETILQCGQKATSSWNLQPWHFTVIRSDEIASGLCRHYTEGSVLIVVSGRIKEEPVGIDPAFDCALAAQNMYLAAQALGYGSRMYYDNIERVNAGMKDELGIPEGYDARIFLLVAHIADGVDAVTSASPRNPLEGNVNYVE